MSSPVQIPPCHLSKDVRRYLPPPLIPPLVNRRSYSERLDIVVHLCECRCHGLEYSTLAVLLPSIVGTPHLGSIEYIHSIRYCFYQSRSQWITPNGLGECLSLTAHRPNTMLRNSRFYRPYRFLALHSRSPVVDTHSIQ